MINLSRISDAAFVSLSIWFFQWLELEKTSLKGHLGDQGLGCKEA